MFPDSFVYDLLARPTFFEVRSMSLPPTPAFYDDVEGEAYPCNVLPPGILLSVRLCFRASGFLSPRELQFSSIVNFPHL